MTLTQYALTFLHQPYRWGGSNPLTGFDCSGFILELLKAFGIEPFRDGTAQDIYAYFKTNGLQTGVGEGSFCFYGKNSSSISHIAYMINKAQVIEAGSGDSTTTTLERAKEQGACIRIRPFNHRKDIVEIIRPDYSEWVSTSWGVSI